MKPPDPDALVPSSPRTLARVGGVFYLALILMGFFAEGVVSNRLIVSGDAVATAEKIVAFPGLWHAGVICNLAVVICAIPLMLIEYILLRPVSRPWMLLALFFNVISLAVESVSKLGLLAVSAILDHPGSLKGFDLPQTQSLAYLAFQLHDVAFDVALCFFGFTLLIVGCLIYRSGFIPRFVGVLVHIAGWSYLVASFAAMFAPALANLVLPAILLPALVGELSYCLWLLVMGVNVSRWQSVLAEGPRSHFLRPAPPA